MESTENSHPEYIMCEKHPYKKAKKYCNAQDCKKFLCNSCCLEEHSQHLNSLQDIQKYYKKELESLENFGVNSDAETTKNNCSFVFKCLVNVFHEAKNYCLECQNFVCVKCSSAHEKTHNIVSNSDLIKNLNEKLKIIKNVFNKEKFVLKIIEEESTLISLSKEANSILESKLLKNAFALKFKFESFLNLLKKLKLNIIGKLSKIFAEKHSCLFAQKFVLTKFASFLDTYKFEKDKNKFFASFIKNENLINSIIKDNEVLEINQLLNLNDKLRDLYGDTVKEYSETLNIFSLEADDFFTKYNERIDNCRTNFIRSFEDFVNKENLAFDKNELLNALRDTGNEIDFNSDDNVHLENVFTGPYNENLNTMNTNTVEIEKNLENKVPAAPKEIIKYITKEVYIEKDKDLLEKEIKQKQLKELQANLALTKAENISLIGETNLNKNSDVNLQKDNQQVEKEIQKIEVEVIKYQKAPCFNDKELTASQENELTILKNEKKKDISDNKLRIVKFDEPKEKSAEFCLDGEYLERNLINVSKNDKGNSSSKSSSEGEAAIDNDEYNTRLANLKIKVNNRRRKYTSSSESSAISNDEETLIENENLKEPENKKDNQDVKEESIKTEIASNISKKADEEINNKPNNIINDNESENNLIIASDTPTNSSSNQNFNTGNTIEIINNEEKKITIPEPNDASSEPLPNEALISASKRTSNASACSQKFSKDIAEKKSYHDILSFGFNCKSCFAFNPSENKITEIENTYFKFPAFHSFLNIPPFAFIGGGKDSQGKELNSFSKFQRTEPKKIEVVELQKMNFARHHHLYVFYRQKQQILCIGGSKIKACEVYDINSDSWTMLGDLNVSRECPSACVTDQNTLYVFFGFDKNVNKYVNTIEKLDLTSAVVNGTNSKSKFEVLNVKGNQNILKKHSAAALQIEPGKVLIFGGINTLRNTSKDVLVYDLKANTGQFFNSSLPVNASFHNCGFVDLNFENEFEGEDGKSNLDQENNANSCSEGKFLYNFTDDFKVVKLNKENFSMEMIE